ncbi:hypothetical protein EDD11_003143 [Mortierella claussenii]|nr:hypothetical protein EDD11_003143 [Mortierella claussenii]
MANTSELPLEIWFQILNQSLNLLLPMATTPRQYSTYILPLLLTSHTFHEHCHPVTYPHLRKHKLLHLFTRWKAAHSREVHFYHHPLRNHVRYALPDRVGNPPGDEYETLYSFIKRAYLFGCESVCGTVIPVEGGLEAPTLVPSAPLAAPAAPAQGNDNNGAAQNDPSTPASTTGTGSNVGNVVIAPPPVHATAPMATHHGVDGGGQGWKSHALQWHVANPTFAAEGTIELYREIVEEYRRVVCGSPAARERNREIERAMDMMKNPRRYSGLAAPEPRPSQLMQSGQSGHIHRTEHVEQIEEVEEVEEAEEDEDDDEHDMIEQDENELLSEIEAKGGLRRRDSGHGQSSSEMDIDDDADEEVEDDMMAMDRQEQEQEQKMGVTELERPRSSKRESESMAMDYQLEGSSRHRRGLRSRKMERSLSTGEQERIIMDMAIDKPSHPISSLSPLHPLETKDISASSSSSSSSASGLGLMRSGSPVPFTPLTPSTRKTRDSSLFGRSKSSRTSLQRSHSSPGTIAAARMSNRSHIGGARSFDHLASTTLAPSPISTAPASQDSALTDISPPVSPVTDSSTLPCSAVPSSPQTRPTKAEDLDFDLASACANAFSSDLAFVLARVPGLGAHFHRFEQLAKLKLQVGWAKHAQSRGGNDVFVMSCSRLISLLAPLANTPLVSERSG